jgi:hypothetical protein
MPKLEDLFVYSDLLPILVTLLLIRKVRERPIWVIFLYNLYSLINNKIVLYYDQKHTEIYNLLYTFTLIEYILFALILFLLIKNKIIKKAILLLSAIFSVFCTYYIVSGNLIAFDSIQTSVECILVIIYCLYFFYEQLINPEVEFIYRSYKFWIVIALLLYLAGSFFLFVYAAKMKFEEKVEYWPILYVSGIIRNLLFAFAIYLSTRKTEEGEYD